MFVILVCDVSALRRCKYRDYLGKMQIFGRIYFVAAKLCFDKDKNCGND